MPNKDSEDDVEIISTDDDKIKLVGEIFSNDSCRKILKLISNKDMTANEIAQKNGMSLTLIIHHLKRMQKAKMIKISKTGISAKGQEMKYYVATKHSFLIIPEKSTHSIIDSLKKFSKFAAIGMAGIVSWMTLKPDSIYNLLQSSEFGQTELDADVTLTTDESTKSLAELDPKVKLEEPIVASTPEPEPMPEPESPYSITEYFDADSDATVYPQPFDIGGESVEPLIFSIIIPIGIVVGGLILERLLTRWYHKRKENKNSGEKY